jgi:hypothetical protein
MKRPTKPAGGKKPAAKKSPAKPRRKRQGQSELVVVVARLDAIADKLALAAERLAQVRASSAIPAVEAPRTHQDEHADDVEVAGASREE